MEGLKVEMVMDDKKEIMNREAWLTEMGRRLEPFFRGFRLAGYRVTCGWPCRYARSRKALRVGECHPIEVSKGGVHEIFISPLLDGSVEVAGTLCHELAHVAAGIGAGHGRTFQRVGRHVGLTKGKPTSLMPGPELEEKVRRIVENMGSYPHKAMILVGRGRKEGEEEKEGRKTVGLTCTDCGCKIRMSGKWFSSVGAPVCACGGEMVEGGKDG
jgi:hypothetical protein